MTLYRVDTEGRRSMNGSFWVEACSAVAAFALAKERVRRDKGHLVGFYVVEEDRPPLIFDSVYKLVREVAA